MTPIHNASTYRLVSQHEFAEVRERADNKQNGLFACKNFSKGEIITAFSAAALLNEPNYLTVQTGDDQHIILSPTFVQYINHHCDPNCFFDTSTMQLVAVKNINTGDEFGFFYPSTEWNMQQPFSCHCGAANCLGEIRGALHLSPEQANQYRLTNYIAQKRSSRL